MEYKAILTKRAEDELDTILERYDMGKTNRGYRLLKQVIITKYLQPDMTLRAIFSDIAKSANTSAGSIAVSLTRLVKRAAKEQGRAFTVSEFVNYCTNSMYSYTEE